ncbi:TPA: hypothetical protein HA231_00570 [Candidatus Woesearchaeota archaeon]|nr:hypothetical protein [Candidatus Woesearchaeota archaeon]
MDAALLAAKYLGRVYIININPGLKGDAMILDTIGTNGRITVFNNAATAGITGSSAVAGIRLRRNGLEKELAVQSAFIEIGYVPSVGFDRLTKKNRWGEIVIHDDKERFMSNLTSVPDIFAAGDVADVPEKQVIVATSEDIKTILSAFRYLGSQSEEY